MLLMFEPLVVFMMIWRPLLRTIRPAVSRAETMSRPILEVESGASVRFRRLTLAVNRMVYVLKTSGVDDRPEWCRRIRPDADWFLPANRFGGIWPQ
jgi:hypothetical protein